MSGDPTFKKVTIMHNIKKEKKEKEEKGKEKRIATLAID